MTPATEINGVWSAAESDWARRHGWDVFVADGRYDISKIDGGLLKSDDAAFGCVKGMAAMGSSVARKALRLHGKAAGNG